MLTREETERYHIFYGRASGIPECCIYFFNTWWENNLDSGLGGKYITYQPDNVGYVCCPNCIRTGNYVRVILNCKDAPDIIERWVKEEKRGPK